MNIDVALLAIFIIAGIMQGTLEWLPVSSEALVFLFLIFCGVEEQAALVLAIMFHLPTGIASILYYRRAYRDAIIDITKLKFSGVSRYLVLASIATLLSAVPLYFILRWIINYLGRETLERAAIIIMIIIGCVMLATGFMIGGSKPVGTKRLVDATDRDSLFIGMVQGFAIFPGVSRSGVTMAALVYRGFDKEDSLNGSFILCGVASIGAFLFVMLVDGSIKWIFNIYIGASMFVSFVLSLLTMNLLVEIAGRLKYGVFLRLIGGIMIVLGLPLALI